MYTNLPTPNISAHSIRPEYVAPSGAHGNSYIPGFNHASQYPSPLLQHLPTSNYDYERNRLATDDIPRTTGAMMVLDEGSIRGEEMLRGHAVLSGPESDFDSSAIGDVEDQYGAWDHEEANDHYLWK